MKNTKKKGKTCETYSWNKGGLKFFRFREYGSLKFKAQRYWKESRLPGARSGGGTLSCSAFEISRGANRDKKKKKYTCFQELTLFVCLFCFCFAYVVFVVVVVVVVVFSLQCISNSTCLGSIQKYFGKRGWAKCRDGQKKKFWPPQRGGGTKSFP